MSLDLTLSDFCPHCKHGKIFHIDNITYNVSKMWHAAYDKDERMIEIEGLTGEQSLQKLREALRALESDPERFEALNPPNGWGSYKGLRKFVKALIWAAEEHPKAVWSASR